jgi:hypothetical protein
MLFGSQFDQGRSFTSLFRKMKAQHAHHILRRFGSEYFGDSRACSTLFIEYQQARLDMAVRDLHNINNASLSGSLFNSSSFKTEEATQFMYWFDQYYRNAFINCMNSYNNYSQPLIIAQDFMNFLLLSKRIFPKQWDFLSAVRGINTRDGDDLQEYKERQVFMVLLNLQHLANFRSLKHWAMILTTTYYGYGAKDTVGHITSFLGITVSRTTRDEFFKQLTLDWVQSF